MLYKKRLYYHNTSYIKFRIIYTVQSFETMSSNLSLELRLHFVKKFKQTHLDNLFLPSNERTKKKKNRKSIKTKSKNNPPIHIFWKKVRKSDQNWGQNEHTPSILPTRFYYSPPADKTAPGAKRRSRSRNRRYWWRSTWAIASWWIGPSSSSSSRPASFSRLNPLSQYPPKLVPAHHRGQTSSRHRSQHPPFATLYGLR